MDLAAPFFETGFANSSQEFFSPVDNENMNMTNPRIFTILRLSLIGVIVWLIGGVIIQAGADLGIWAALGWLIVHGGSALIDMIAPFFSIETVFWGAIFAGVIVYAKARA